MQIAANKASIKADSEKMKELRIYKEKNNLSLRALRLERSGR
jgi:hypothetical protein